MQLKSKQIIRSGEKIYFLNNLPKIPKSLIQYDFNTTSWPVTSDIELTRKKQTFNAGIYIKNTVSKELEEWCRNNIIKEWGDIGFSCINGPCLGPHMDQYRLYTLQYIIDTGGPEVDTVFYDAAHDKVKMLPRFKFNCYDDLVATDSYRVTSDTWCLIDGRNIHSVENIKTQRIALQISLMRNPLVYDSFV